jgi:hypothetical protein
MKAKGLERWRALIVRLANSNVQQAKRSIPEDKYLLFSGFGHIKCVHH